MDKNLPSTLQADMVEAANLQPARDWLGCIGGVFMVTSMTILVGCVALPADIQDRSQRGYVYYLDGAGGGGELSNWSSGIREGLRKAGYPGWGEMFSWQTGLGVAFDQVASDTYKRGKAAELAGRIVRFRQDHPDAPITLIGFSAGSAVAVYTLESLPTSLMVENVILLSGSLSADYDLTRALAHVRQWMYIFTSDRDVILTVLVPISGPADRRAGTRSVIGVSGAVMPANPGLETERQYAKVVEVRWNPSFRGVADRGGHTDTVNEMFVRTFVAPLVFVAPTAQAEVAPAPGRVRNPDYQHWAPFAPGSWALLEGTCTSHGRTDTCRLKTTLISKTAASAVIEHDLTINGRRPAEIPFRQRSILMADIDPQDHPITHPNARALRVGQVEMSVHGKLIRCDITRISVPGTFDLWGDDIRADAQTTSIVPGYLAGLKLSTTFDGSDYEFALVMVEFWIAEKARVYPNGMDRSGGSMEEHWMARSYVADSSMIAASASAVSRVEGQR